MNQMPTDSEQQLVFTKHLAPALPEALEAVNAKRVLLLTGASGRYAQEVIDLLNAEVVEVFDGAIVHVPSPVVEKASVVLETMRADTVISLGGGAVTGLAKALRLKYDVGFIALPTTYSGAERTPVFGITTNGNKQTGPDPRARADVVVYNSAFTLGMSKKLTTQSLLNALAHPISALTTGTLEGADKSDALRVVRKTLHALETLVETPGNAEARLQALRAASDCAGILVKGVIGRHHGMAHRLGGRFNLDHAGLHSVLLPHTIRYLENTHSELMDDIHESTGSRDLPGAIFDLMIRAGAQTSLSELGVDGVELDAFVTQEPELDQGLLQRAFYGRRPSVHIQLQACDLNEPLASIGPAPENARLTIIALHGWGSNAEAMLRRITEITGDTQDIAIVAPQASGAVWYTKSYATPLEDHAQDLEQSLALVQSVVEQVGRKTSTRNIVLAGFSQGACLAIEFMARTGQQFAGLMAFSGARIGPQRDYAEVEGSFDGMPVILGVSEADPWIKRDDVDATAASFEQAGAKVLLLNSSGDEHVVTALQKISGREVLKGHSLREGQGGFANAFESEALPDALPRDQNSPRLSAYGLYAEQINATGFVARREHNRRSWVYRIRPAAQHSKLEPLDHPTYRQDFDLDNPEPNLSGWAPLPMPDSPTDFVDGIYTLGGSGGAEVRRGFAVHLYVANRSMENRSFYNADGEMLLVPQQGKLTLQTESGVLDVDPGMVAIIPRGLKFSVLLREDHARGYIGEVFGRSFHLPERGPVGANGLADSRHFRAPVAYHENRLVPGYSITAKFCGKLFGATQDYSPYDVVAWHGDYTPYVYELRHFSPVINGRMDHADPSIFSVLTAPLDEEGANNLDFVFFPPRWDVSEGTFRPPFFHRNAVTEINGIIRDPAGYKAPFYSGGCFITPAMTAHGIRAGGVEGFLSMSDEAADRPHRFRDNSMWFQFETVLPFYLTSWAKKAGQRIDDWHHIWGTYRDHYQPPNSE